MDYRKFTERAHRNAVNHGFWESVQSPEHYLMLVVTEIAEAVNSDRKGKRADRYGFEHNISAPISKHETAYTDERFSYWFEQFIKDSVEDELADVAIRLFDLAGALYIEPHRIIMRTEFEGLSFTEMAYKICKFLVNDNLTIAHKVCAALNHTVYWAESLNIDLEWHIEKKMKYNESRPNKHGKRY